jgi:hypothetical protein
MIKQKTLLLLTIFQLSSCAHISFSDSLPLMKAAIVGFENIPVTIEEFENNKYSFIVAKFDRGQEARMILSQINARGIETWVGPKGVKIFILNGRVLKTEGFDHDYEVIDWTDLDMGSEQTNLVILSKPKAIFKRSLFLDLPQETFIDFHFEGSIETTVVQENIYFHELSYRKQNFYWFGNDGKIKRTRQFINPKLPQLTIDFFYKY